MQALVASLMQEYYGIRWWMPPTSKQLVPGLANRENYLRWLQDLEQQRRGGDPGMWGAVEHRWNNQVMC